jgi:hypothetical protein
MKIVSKVAVVAVGILLLVAFFDVHAQQPQIPTLQVCNSTKVEGKAAVKIGSRQDSMHPGIFDVRIEAKCDPGELPYPDGMLEIQINMSDSLIQGLVKVTEFEQLTSTGKHSPTAYLTGRCKTERFRGCRFWMMLADNKTEDERGTPDVIGFLIFDGNGKRVAYGTGPVVKGDIDVTDTGY